MDDQRHRAGTGKGGKTVPDEHRAGVEGGETREELFKRGREGMAAARHVPQERGLDNGLWCIEGKPQGGEKVGRAGEQEIVDGEERIEREKTGGEWTQRRMRWRRR